MTVSLSNIDFNSVARIVGMLDPVSAQDGATKNYVDATIQGLSPKNSAQLATTTALPTNTYANGVSGVGATLTGVATGVLTIDGTAVALGNRIVVKNEVASANNGIYICSTAGSVGVAYVLTRTNDADTSAKLDGAFVFVEIGTTNTATGWTIANATFITIGTTAINWTQFSGAGTYTNGTGLSLTGSQFSLASMAANTIKGNATGAAAVPTNLTATEATALLNAFTSALKGLVPASGGGTTNFLRADGSWAAPAGGGGSGISIGLSKCIALGMTV
jgi:hypothetical protein